MTTALDAPVRAKAPFHFATASYLVRIGNHIAYNLLDLQREIAACSDASIFYHTFQSLARHHFLTEGFSNDFAQWVLAACNRPVLAEQLASLDIRDYVSLADLRTDIGRVLKDYCGRNSRECQQAGFEPFYFCESLEEEVPFGQQAWTLAEFHDVLVNLPHGSLQFHFLNSRLRLHLRTNDFSVWLAEDLGLTELAKRIDQIDIYPNTLDSARGKIISLIERELRR
jgi:hypothetical protein